MFKSASDVLDDFDHYDVVVGELVTNLMSTFGKKDSQMYKTLMVGLPIVLTSIRPLKITWDETIPNSVKKHL